MLFPARCWPGLRDGTITVAFRRWKRPSVKASGTLQTGAGVLAIDEVAIISLDEVTDGDARAAGFSDRDAAIAALRPEGTLYRVRLHHIGDDPRIALRQQDDLDDDELVRLRRRLERLDWAATTLRLIAAHPGTVSTDLAAELGLERKRFKLGLTESLKAGYRLSPRGLAVLTRIDA